MSCDVALVVHGGRVEARALADHTATLLRERQLACQIISMASSAAGGEEHELDAVAPRLIVSLGGDGTFLRASSRAHRLDVPILGVNFGRVGYLLDVPPTELHSVILQALDGALPIEHRAVLSLAVHHDGSNSETHIAVNELSLEKTTPGHVVRISTQIDGEQFLNFAADGVLVATPTGSTAYNLSAGGPVVAPSVDCIILTPVAPHFVVDRSVVLSGQQTVRLEVVGDRPAVCVVDGTTIDTLNPGDHVVCTRDERWLKVVTLSERGIGRRLREGLRQGHE